MRQGLREETLAYRGHEKKITTLGLWCDNFYCGNSIVEGQALLAREKVWVELKAEADADPKTAAGDRRLFSARLP